MLVVLLRHENEVWSFVEVNLIETLDFSGSIRSVDFKDAENLVLLVDDNGN